LRDLLAKPFQRIFGYKNIFEKMLKNTPKASPYYEKMYDLVQQTEGLVAHINEYKRQFENVQKVSDLQKRMSHTTWGGETPEFQKVMHCIITKPNYFRFC
jgi:hemoglobin-like flavoprotein